ncbi:MAG: tRNA (adenine-N1)-methyltransferase [Planctomycetes bacterium]|nr:tRNA (adenine-N1)-methyltransferase [Planctomycetota bacterium]
MSEGLRVGEPIEFLQFGKAKPYLVVLKAQGTINVRGHRFAHAELVGLEPGSRLVSPQGEEFFVVRPTLARWVESMPRFAKTIYPKEAGPILLYGDLFAGARVLEAGLGSGGLSLSLLRAIGPEGRLFSYDTRERSLQQGADNVALWYGGPHPAHTIRQVDVYQEIPDGDLDRVVLDVPEPWQVVPHTEQALRRGGILCAFVPSITQTHEFVNALRDSGRFADLTVLETIQRPWQVGRRSIRPENQATPHTGFVTVARHVEGRPALPPEASTDDAERVVRSAG